MPPYSLDLSSNLKAPSQDDFKASYDDLLDEDVTPYAPTARHRTYTVDSLSGSLRSPATPPSHKTHFSAKQSDDLSQDTSRAVYPPQHVTKEANVSFWKKVREPPVTRTKSDCLTDAARITGMSSLCAYSTRRDGSRLGRRRRAGSAYSASCFCE